MLLSYVVELKNVVIISLYCIGRSPWGDLRVLFVNFELAMTSILKGGHLVIVCGDFNFEMVSTLSHGLAFLFKSLNLKCTVKSLTHENSRIEKFSANWINHNTQLKCLKKFLVH